MYEKYLAEIKQMLSCMSEKDIQIVARIYGILRIYLEKRGDVSPPSFFADSHVILKSIILQQILMYRPIHDRFASFR